MTTFEQRRSALGLTKFLDSPRGTMFLSDFSHTVVQDDILMSPLVRRLDGFITPALAPVYAKMVNAADAWVAQHPDLDIFVRVMPIIDIGEDYIERMHFPSNGTSAFARDEEEDRPELPPELEKMRVAFEAAKGKLTDPKSLIIERVLERNLLEPSDLTFFDDQEGVFIVIEPRAFASKAGSFRSDS